MSQQGFRLVPLLVSLLALAACMAQGESFHRIDKKIGGFTQHYAESRFAVTRRGSHDIELLLTANDLRVGENAFEFIVHDSGDKDIEGAQVAMAAVTAGKNADLGVSVIDEGNGLYFVKNLTVGAPGPFTLKVTVSRAGIEDDATFDFAVPPPEAKP